MEAPSPEFSFLYHLYVDDSIRIYTMSIITTFTVFSLLGLTSAAFTALVNHTNKPKKEPTLSGWAIIDGEYFNFDEVKDEIR